MPNVMAALPNICGPSVQRRKVCLTPTRLLECRAVKQHSHCAQRCAAVLSGALRGTAQRRAAPRSAALRGAAQRRAAPRVIALLCRQFIYANRMQMK